MDSTKVTLTVRGNTAMGEVIAVVGSCETLGSWCHQKAVTLQPAEEDGTLWRATVQVPRGGETKYRYFKGFILESKNAGGPCQVIVSRWETHQLPRSLSPSEPELVIDDGHFGIHSGVECVDSGWLTCQTEIRLRLHYSVKPPVSITKKQFKKSRFRLKLMLEGFEEDEEESPSSLHKMTTTLETSMISDSDYKSRHSQPECGYALEPSQWTEYSIHTMDPDNLELTFEFFEEDLSETVVQGDVHPGYVGTACLLSSSFVESGKDQGVVTLPIMSRNARQTIGKVRVDYLVTRPIQDFQCDMRQSFTKYWKKRSALDVGHRGAGSTLAPKHHKIRENTIASFLSAANHGAAYVEFDVHLSEDLVPIVYHDLTCCISIKKKTDKNSMVLFEVPVKDLTFDQLQLLKLVHTTAMEVHDHKDLQDEEVYIDEHQSFPSLSQIFQAVPDHVGFNIELKWISQFKDGSWDGKLSSYFNMNQFLDIILTCVLQNAGNRRIVFSCFDPDVCTMVRQKQNKYPILFLTQGVTDLYPELMDIRCQSTKIAMSFAQSENILGISAHTDELLQNMEFIREAQSKGLVVFCWGDYNNDHENRMKLREQGIDGLIYDRICDDKLEQPNIFKVEEQGGTLKEVIQTCACSSYSIPCSSMPCAGKAQEANGESDSGLSSS
ncbi:glycerophosphocholine phosphodiesterase GPCPD1-like [Sinocyclocheilus rhinocerous]|uniref:glycerophosphocholine phosphodiesterase GPCPD1-like n=1 Tax=Sinocyclocheilus rhinocerous TaxID=307959 RepID=UPI0007B8D4E9|nr:PREDICTED: glycerophosphocholine phosphodiesterase GPCPD1-like [Sinocyclocheilus rhinocerous]XP_016429355.1 PREDICTED: glycerophosphocholine phosphodiesterase GPCPD1-like [Sinocyclocheilus rhinocerous]XP_016429356.1 PREDICTED: glycerophosphocholine phosphodiesterase GPCPD1-like [Sinocyclocheilus rhinocerous]XP_016429357.1 PREDICTED: glycerophosphocholine phosphodiesterase GPCPD1-like [Sinocyclocheilus rhinocerous]